MIALAADLAAQESQEFLKERLSGGLLSPTLSDAVRLALSAPGNALSETSLWARIAAAAQGSSFFDQRPSNSHIRGLSWRAISTP